jgi:hypothetical protein
MEAREFPSEAGRSQCRPRPGGAIFGPIYRVSRQFVVAPLALPAWGGDATTGVSCGVGPQQSQAQGGQVWPAVQAGQAQPQPLGGGGFVVPRAQVPVGQGAVTHSMLSDVQTQALLVSAAQVLASV